MENVKKYIGSGRSAKVFMCSREGKNIATKIFTGENTSKIILFILTGSANPYTWCEQAIQSAVTRRRLLDCLCNYWFKDSIRVPETFEYRWNPEQKAYEIDAEFIDGQHAPLLNPLQDHSVDYMKMLRRDVMGPLQAKLIEAGFDGLVWQAGKGNPVAASNFMLTRNRDNSRYWTWIDLESGLPALFALNPLATLFYYLPMCVKHRGWLFDDVDTTCLKEYLEAHKSEIEKELGKDIFVQLISYRSSLEESQRGWKSLSRHKKSLYYAYSQDKITPGERDYFANKPLRWFAKNTLQVLASFFSAVKENLTRLTNSIYTYRYKKQFYRLYRYATNSHYRWGSIRWYLKKEVNRWYFRGFLTTAERKILHQELHSDDTSAYLTDFSIHIGLKPLYKPFQWGVVPVLVATGTVSIGAGALLVLWTGPFVRTVYTLWRISHGLVKLRPHYPLVALAVGTLPVFGNFAYPMEILYRSTGNEDMMGKFITCSLGAKVGAKIPFWGGQDSEIEHFFGRLGHGIGHLRLSSRAG